NNASRRRCRRRANFYSSTAEYSSRYARRKQGLPLGALVLCGLAALFTKVPAFVDTAWVFSFD
ncbi:MAG TPA: hypothetical protein VJB05_02290, partial [archaeon]|nr:hypothetical protein [archaeon]